MNGRTKKCPTCGKTFRVVYSRQWRCLDCTKAWRQQQIKKQEAAALDQLKPKDGFPEPIAPGVKG